jgi:hypothetical protein
VRVVEDMGKSFVGRVFVLILVGRRQYSSNQLRQRAVDAFFVVSRHLEGLSCASLQAGEVVVMGRGGGGTDVVVWAKARAGHELLWANQHQALELCIPPRFLVTLPVVLREIGQLLIGSNIL